VADYPEWRVTFSLHFNRLLAKNRNLKEIQNGGAIHVTKGWLIIRGDMLLFLSVLTNYYPKIEI
jgi:hypothetical protein